MNAKAYVRHSLAHRADNLEHFRGQRAAIGIAQHHPRGSALMRRFHTIYGVARVVLVAVEEMLTIEYRLAALVHGGGNRPADHVQIFLKACLDRGLDMEIPGFADKAGGRNLGIKDGVQPRVVGGAAAATAGHAKGHHARVSGLRRRGEKGIVCRVGAGPAALDVIDANLVQRGGNRDLVGLREVDTAGLSPVAERRIEQPDPIIVHHPVPCRMPRNGTCQR